MLMTVFSILAVDFPVFPRNLVKCEIFGVSLAWHLDCEILFLSVNIKRNLDGLWCRIFCVLARRWYLLTTYQRPRLSNFSNPVLVYTCSSQIASNHYPRSYLRYSRRRNGLFGNLFRWSFFILVESLFLKHMKRNTDDNGIFSLLL